MFPLPYEAPLDHLLYALFALEWALLGGGLLLGRLNSERTGRLPRPLRILLSALLVVAAFLQWRYGRGPGAVRLYGQLIFLGMTASFVGDLIMARLIPVPNRLIFGMAVFGIGHSFYVAAFAHLLRKSAPVRPAVAAIVSAAVLAVGIGAWYGFVRNPDRGRAINIGSLFYGLLFGFASSLAILLALVNPHYVSLAAGSLLFMLSDVILGSWVIRGRAWTGVNDVVWVTYVSGQLLIVYSVAAALNAWHGMPGLA
jgi:uncharacterized membrane protein YhhN